MGPSAGLKRRALRLAAVACLAFGVAAALKAFGVGGRTILLSYHAPAGALEVTLRDGEGAMLRRTRFAAEASRSHEVDLPEGTFDAELRLDRQTRRVPLLVGPETSTLEVVW